MHREKEELSRFLERDDESAKIRIENDIGVNSYMVHMYVCSCCPPDSWLHFEKDMNIKKKHSLHPF